MTTREHAPLAVLAVKCAVANILQRAPAGAFGVGCVYFVCVHMHWVVGFILCVHGYTRTHACYIVGLRPPSHQIPTQPPKTQTNTGDTSAAAAEARAGIEAAVAEIREMYPSKQHFTRTKGKALVVYL